MDFFEFLILVSGGIISFVYISKWCRKLGNVWPKPTGATSFVLAVLPFAVITAILYTLIALASFDVEGIYVLIYLVFGFSWVFVSMTFFSFLFDLSWMDDALYLGNKAALAAVAGVCFGLTAIYSGANVGDGPGWWCVLFAGGLGTAAWFMLCAVINKFTHIFERITVNRDLGCGIRMFFYLTASGIILARASAGDWTSISATVVEFADGWPALVLAAAAIIVERRYIAQDKADTAAEFKRNTVLSSLFWGAIYITAAVLAVALVLPPLPENPIYSVLAVGGLL